VRFLKLSGIWKQGTPKEKSSSRWSDFQAQAEQS
jgi:hypothetical protein